MTTNREKIFMVDNEIKALSENPMYVDYVKIKTVMQKGQVIEKILNKRVALARMLIDKEKQALAYQQQQQQQQQQQEEYNDTDDMEVPEPPQRARVNVPPKERVEVPPPQANQEPERPYNYKPEEVGIDEEPEIDGLPDLDFDESGDKE